MKKIVMCVEDRPNDWFADPAEGILKEKLGSIYEGKYDVEFADSWDAYNRLLNGKNAKHIALVLLDYELNFGERKDMHAPDIVDDLLVRRPDLRIICLTNKIAKPIVIKGKKKTEEGKRKEMGQQDKEVEFIYKSKLSAQARYLRNISEAIIEDYENNRLDVLWEPIQGSLTLSRGKDNCSVHVGKSFEEVLTWSLRVSNKFAGPFWSKGIVGKTKEAVNRIIRKQSNGHFWGIFTTEDAPTRCLKALVNPCNVVIKYRAAPVKCKKAGAPCDCIDAFARLEGKVAEMYEKFKECCADKQAATSGLKAEDAYIAEENEKGLARAGSDNNERFSKRIQRLESKLKK